MRFVRQIRWLVVFPILAIAPALATAEFTKDSLKTIRENVLKKKAVLVDVRSQKEWDAGHIEGSIFLPVTALEDEEIDVETLAKILPRKKIVYTFCVVGMRAEAAGEILQEEGFHVRVLKHGYKELVKAGFKKAKQKKSGDENTRQRNAG